ncbi:lipase maturation factor family protein [Mucilaginibacter sp. Mucisp86]|uniref:lipase maturation factor family protein n=1 Tax=Mucilaginibacter sp. Mucisp86 TaxID=3243060 RepID=UPI0039B6A97C
MLDSQEHTPQYWLTRFVILRLLGLVYAVAFLVAINQVLPLVGSHGLLPVDKYLQQISIALGSKSAAFFRLPSLFWFWHSDTALLLASWTGFILSLIVVAGYANALSMGILWILYLSLVHVGQDWYGYGWEIQLTETGFLAIFLCPLLDMRPFPKRPPPLLIIILFRWLIFRIMFGAGMIKYRGDEVWRKGTALYYYFETQPIPGPFSRWFHFLPRVLLRLGVWFNWLAELLAPWFVFGPRVFRHIAGIIIILLQCAIILSGNLSFLNWLTIVPALACMDDGFWAKLLPGVLVRKAAKAEEEAEISQPMQYTALVIACIVGLLSFQPAFNLLSPKQIMNTSFDPLELVNTYGAFGSVGQERYNVVFEGTRGFNPDSANWQAYPYKGLPVDLNQQPSQVAPYQLRLDWQMWFAAMSTADQYPWTYHLAWKLLHNDPGAVGLFAGNPFPGKPPRYIRAVIYRYRFARPGHAAGPYWERERLGLWLPVLSVQNPQFVAYLKGQGWIK